MTPLQERLKTRRLQIKEDLNKIKYHFNWWQLNTDVLEYHTIVYDYNKRVWAWTDITFKNAKTIIDMTRLHKVVSKFLDFDFLQFSFHKESSILRINYKAK